MSGLPDSLVLFVQRVIARCVDESVMVAWIISQLEPDGISSSICLNCPEVVA